MGNVKLRQEVKKNFRTYAEFSLAIGWTTQKVNKMLKGIYVPKLSEAQKICRALHITIDELASFFAD